MPSRLVRKPGIAEISGSLYRQHPRYQGCVGHWPFTEAGGVTLHDISGRGHHGTLTNLTLSTDWVRSQGGYCIDFPGSTDHVDMGDVLDPGTNDITVSWWYRSPALAGATDFHVEKGARSTGDAGFSVGTKQATIRLFARFGDGTTRVESTAGTSLSGFDDDEWHHLAVSFDRSSIVTFYVDGQSEAGDSIATYDGTNVTNGSRNFGIGRDVGGGPNGLVDEMRVYHRLLSPQAIEWLYREPYAEFEIPKKRGFVAVVVGGDPEAGLVGGKLLHGGLLLGGRLVR